MSISQNKPHLKIIKKSEFNETKTVNSLQEGQTVGQQQKRKRNRFKNIDWEQVLDFDTLVLNSQVYEAPWMRTTKKRKRICKSSDKNGSTSSLLTTSNDIKDSDNTNNPTSTSSINEPNTINTYKKITGVSNNSGGSRSKDKKQQKKSTKNDVSVQNTSKLMKLESSSNMKGKANIDSLDEDSVSQQKEKEEFININNTKKTRLQSQKERESKAQTEESILQQNYSQQNTVSIAQSLKKKVDTSATSSRNNTPGPEERANTPSKTITRQEGKKLLKGNSNETSSENLERMQSPIRNQYRKKFIRNTLKSNEEEVSFTIEKKDSIIEDGIKSNSNLNGAQSQQLPPMTRSQMKRSPTSQRLNEDILVINQSYDDSDASTRDEDHQDNASLSTQFKTINNSNNNALKDGRRVTRQTSSLNERSSKNQTPQKKSEEMKKKNEAEYEEVEECQAEEGEEEEKMEIEEEDENQLENEQGIKEQYSSVLKIKQLKNKSTSSVEVGDENQINKKKGNNNNNQKKNKRDNKNLINKKLDEIVNSNQTPLLVSSDQNTSEQIESNGKIYSCDSLNKFQSQNTLKGDSKSVQSTSVQNLEESYIPQKKKSNFSKKQQQTEEITSASSLVSEQNLDKIEDEMNVEESGFENSNNNALAMLQQQNNQQEVDLDQQQVPHLYIRNSDYATKVGRKYQAVIPELGTYQPQNKHLERLITDQKVWGRDWIEEKQMKVITKCTATLKQWYGNKRTEEQCIQHLMHLDFDHTKYNLFLEENQEYFYTLYNNQDAKFLKKKAKKKSLFSCK